MPTTTTTTTTYSVSIRLLDREAVRTETDLDLDPTMPGQVSTDSFWAQWDQDRYSVCAPSNFPLVLRVEAGSVEEAAEVAYGILNSYPASADHPAELHCDLKYAQYIMEYRLGGYRSLSKGDIVIVRTPGAPAVMLGVNGAGFTVL